MTLRKLDHQHLLEASNGLHEFDEFSHADATGERSLSWTNLLLASVAHSLLSIAEDSRQARVDAEASDSGVRFELVDEATFDAGKRS